MPSQDKTIHHVIRWLFCILYANSLVVAIVSGTVISVSYFSLVLCTTLATTVFYVLYSLKRVFKIACIVFAGLVVLGVIGYLIASFTGNAPSVNVLYYDVIDLLAGVKKITPAQQQVVVYGASVLISLVTAMLLARRVIFSVLSIIAGVSFFGQMLTGNLSSENAYLCLLFTVLFIGVYSVFLRFERRSGGLGFGRRYLLTLPVCAVVTMLVLITSAIVPLQGAYTKYLAIENFSRNAFVRNGEGSYFLAWSGIGLDDDDLGGPIKINSTKVLRLEYDQPLYLAANTKDVYTGRSWTMSDISKEKFDGKVDVSTQVKLDAFKNAGLSYEENNVKVRVGEKMKFRNVFQGSDLKEIPEPRGRTLWTDLNKNLFTNATLRNGFTYSFSQYTFAHEDMVKLARESYIGKQSEDPSISTELRDELTTIYDIYTKLPETLPVRVRDLAEQITQGKETNYDKVLALQEYLYQFTYTLNAPQTPRDRDFVDYFLFDLQEGYCTYFASSLAVMARSIGMPARYVEGFAQQPEDKGNEVEITNSMAHAWVEVYFEGLGWMTFEPTPPNAETVYGIKMEDYREQPSEEEPVTSEPEEEEPVVESTPVESLGESLDGTSSAGTVSVPPPSNNLGNTVVIGDPDSEGGLKITVQDLLNVLFILLAVVIVILIPVLLTKGRKKQMLRLQTYDNRTFIAACWKELVRLMKFDGTRMETGETIHLFLDRLSEKVETQ